MGAKGSRSYNGAYPRLSSRERNTANSPNGLISGYHLGPNEFLSSAIHQSRFNANGMQAHHMGAQNCPIINGSTRIPYNSNINSKVDNFGVTKDGDKNFRNSYFDGNEISNLRLAKRPPLSKSTLLQELLECPICMNLYENPHVLPCQHTFCKKCLILLQNNESNIKTTLDCPICREKHTLPNGIDGLAANYTMKRLIELDAMAAEKEKEKSLKEKAKCFVCQKYSHLKVCVDCSYMLCSDCIEIENHEILIESRLNSRIANYNNFKANVLNAKKTVVSVAKPPLPKYKKPEQTFEPFELYTEPKYRMEDDRLKLILLCHSSIVEINQDKKEREENSEIYEDEHGKCKTFSKIIVSINERVITLKKIIETKFGISCKDQILVYKDQILKSDLKLLSSFNIRQYARIHIFDERDIKANASDFGDDLYGIYQDADFEQVNESINQKKSINSKLETSDTKKESINSKNANAQKRISPECKSTDIASTESRSCSSSSSISTGSANNKKINASLYANEHTGQQFKRNMNYQTTYKYPLMKREHLERPEYYRMNRNSSLYGSTRHFSNQSDYPMKTRYRNVHELFN